MEVEVLGSQETLFKMLTFAHWSGFNLKSELWGYLVSPNLKPWFENELCCVKSKSKTKQKTKMVSEAGRSVRKGRRWQKWDLLYLPVLTISPEFKYIQLSFYDNFCRESWLQFWKVDHDCPFHKGHRRGWEKVPLGNLWAGDDGLCSVGWHVWTWIQFQQELPSDRSWPKREKAGLAPRILAWATERILKCIWKTIVGEGSSLEAKLEFRSGLEVVGPSCFG